MNKAELIALARTVADLRIQSACLGVLLAGKQEAFRRTLEAEFAEHEDIQRKLMDAENALRAGGLELYKETKDKHPSPGIEVKEKTVLEYETGDALAWATKAGMFLKLDAARFEKVAPDLNLAFVKISKVPQAQLARDMDKALAELPKTE